MSRELQGAGSTATGRLLQGRRQPAWGMDGSFQNSGAEQGGGENGPQQADPRRPWLVFALRSEDNAKPTARRARGVPTRCYTTDLKRDVVGRPEAKSAALGPSAPGAQVSPGP